MKKTLLTLSFIAAAYLLKAQVLYGTTRLGGNNNSGTICKLVVTTKTLTASFSFDAVDGTNPASGKLLQASDGKLYGVTTQGGDDGYGIIFLYDPATSSYTKLKDFDYANGGSPSGSLIEASDGKLYGMTSSGGSSYAGTIFSYDPASSTYTRLIDFDNTNGAYPSGSLIQAYDGRLYGMTNSGGASDYGVIFSYDPAASAYIKLIDFDGTNGANPFGSLVQASDGKFYGVASRGGDKDYGVIFSFDPATSTYTRLKDFDYTNGSNPRSSLIQASNGKLYGMTSYGGSDVYGVIFSFDPSTSTFTNLKDFDYSNGAYPQGGFVQASDGKLYGTTHSGGSNGYGVIFSFDPATSTYTKLEDFDFTNGANPYGDLAQAPDGNLYGTTNGGGSTGVPGRFGDGVIFSFDPAASTYTKLKDFGTNNTGHYILGALVKDESKKLYGITFDGGSHGAGTIFSYDAGTSVFTKFKDFDVINGANPYGSLVQASDGKLYGMTYSGGDNDYGVIFSFDPSTSTYTRLMDFDGANGANPFGSLIQASDGKLYGMTTYGGDNDYGVIFSFDPTTSSYTKRKDFDGTNGGSPTGSLVEASDGNLYGMAGRGGDSGHGVIFSFDPFTSSYTKMKDFDYTNGGGPSGSLIQASDGKLYGITVSGGIYNYFGVIFSFDPATSTYTKLKDFDGTNGASPTGSLVQASDGKLYGMTTYSGSNNFGVAFSYDPNTSTYTKLSDFNGDNGSYPAYTSFIEIPGGEVQISIADKSVIEGNQDRKFIAIPVILSEKSEKIIRFNYTTRNNTAKAGSDYIAQSGKLVFPPGLKKIILPIRITGDQTPEANETFRIVLSDPVNATIADSTGIVTISDDDASALNATQEASNTMNAINLSPNPAQDKVKIMLTGYSGNVVIQLSSFDGRILQQQKLKVNSIKLMEQQMNVSGYANGIYLVTAIDEKGNRQTVRLVVDR